MKAALTMSGVIEIKRKVGDFNRSYKIVNDRVCQTFIYAYAKHLNYKE